MPRSVRPSRRGQYALAGVLLALLAFPTTAAAQDQAASAVPLWHGPDGEPLPFRTYAEAEVFLRDARVVSSRLYGEGIAGLKEVLFEHNGIQARAGFHEIDDQTGEVPMNGRFFRTYYDSYRGQCAAYAVARLLQLDYVPPIVCRRVEGIRGSVQLWVEGGTLEAERLAEGMRPPVALDWMRQVQAMHLFDNLIFNDDRHSRNYLYDAQWRLWLIDHTRAFQTRGELRDPGKLALCERRLWERLQAITQDQLRRVVSEYLEPRQVSALARRHGLLVAHIAELIAVRGEGAVLIDSQ